MTGSLQRLGGSAWAADRAGGARGCAGHRAAGAGEADGGRADRYRGACAWAGRELRHRGRGPEDLARRLNGVGPDDVAVTAASVVEDSFDARHSAKSRSYRYRLLARSSTEPLRAEPRPLVAPSHRPGGSESLRICSPRNARLHRLHPDPDRPRPLRPRHPRRFLDARRRHPHLPHHRRRLHAKHGPNPRRHDARSSLRPPLPRKLHEATSGRPALRSRRHGPPHGLYLESVSY